MSKMSLDESVSALRKELAMASDYGALVPISAADLAATDQELALPGALRAFYVAANPQDFEVPWVVEWLSLYPAEELPACQEGYRFPVGDPSRLLSGWHPEWIVIGDVSGDPIIVDNRVDDAPVMMAVHGQGDWAPKQVSSSISDFLLFIAEWLQAFRTKNGDIRENDGSLRSDVLDEIESRAAAHLSLTDRESLMSFIG